MTASAGPALRRLHDTFGDRIAFLTQYVREAHPGERFPQPATFEEKLRHARSYRARDAVPWPVAVDDLDGSVHRRLDEKPNAAYLVGADGTVVFRTLWSNHEGVLREALEAVADGRTPDPAEREPRLGPLLGGGGEMAEILGMAGAQARRDVRREMPPVWALARVAQLFRPLPSHRRGALATALVVTGLAGVGAAAWRLWRRR